MDPLTAFTGGYKAGEILSGFATVEVTATIRNESSEHIVVALGFPELKPKTRSVGWFYIPPRRVTNLPFVIWRPIINHGTFVRIHGRSADNRYTWHNKHTSSFYAAFPSGHFEVEENQRSAFLAYNVTGSESSVELDAMSENVTHIREVKAFAKLVKGDFTYTFTD